MSVVLYGSFDCPYSFLASLRVDRLIAAGDVAVEWRAVVHDPAVAPEGEWTSGELAALPDRELEEIRGLLAPGEACPARRPAVQASTTAAVAGETMRRRQRAWEGMDQRVVPMMVLPGGRVLRGTEVLSCLAVMTTAGAGGPHGS